MGFVDRSVGLALLLGGILVPAGGSKASGVDNSPPRPLQDPEDMWEFRRSLELPQRGISPWGAPVSNSSSPISSGPRARAVLLGVLELE